jgi:hypothetical protein
MFWFHEYCNGLTLIVESQFNNLLKKSDVALVILSVSTLDVGCINPEEIK